MSTALISENDLSSLKEEALAHDASDPLRNFKPRFATPPNSVYLASHSLGLRSDRAHEYSYEAFEKWEHLGVEAWFDKEEHSHLGPWIELERAIAKELAPFLGAKPLDVTVGSSLGVNLLLLLHTFFRPTAKRRKILVPRAMFPQDRWLMQQHIKLPGYSHGEIEWINPRPGEKLLREEDLVLRLNRDSEEIALFVIEAVSYLTGQYLNIEALARECNRQRIPMILDVAHAAFVTPLELNNWGVDAAVGCSYKFGAAGPGSVGILYVNERHTSNPELWRPGGWWGNKLESRMLMGQTWEPCAGAAAWQVGTLPVLAAAPFLGVLKLYTEAGNLEMRKKITAMNGYALKALSRIKNRERFFEVLTPIDSARQGAEIVLHFYENEFAKQLKNYLRTAGVTVDYRESPFKDDQAQSSAGIVRVGLHPLSNSFSDIFEFISKFNRVPFKSWN